MMLYLLLLPAVESMPPYLTRGDWGAKPAIANPMAHSIRYITIHHTGVAQKPEVDLRTKLRNLQSWSQREDKTSFAKVKPIWPDIPYHYYIDAHGQIAEGREAKWVGDTNTEYDPTGHLLIVLEGNFEKETPSEAQLRSMEAMTRWAARKYGVPRVRIGGHGDYAKTSCPGPALAPSVQRLKISF